MDLWHQRRIFRLEGSDEPLHFGEPPLVLEHLVVTWEPIWRTVIATATTGGTEDLFAGWTWQAPLPPALAGKLATSLGPVIAEIRRSGIVAIPPEIADADLPDAPIVVKVLEVLCALLRQAVAQNCNVETWIG